MLAPMLAGQHMKATPKRCRNKNSIHSWNQYADRGACVPANQWEVYIKANLSMHIKQQLQLHCVDHIHQLSALIRTTSAIFHKRSVFPRKAFCLMCSQQGRKWAKLQRQHRMSAVHNTKQWQVWKRVKNDREVPSRQPGTSAMEKLPRWPVTIPRPPPSRSSLATVPGFSSDRVTSMPS